MLFAFSIKRNVEMMKEENAVLFPKGVRVKEVVNYLELGTCESKIRFQTLT